MAAMSDAVKESECGNELVAHILYMRGLSRRVKTRKKCDCEFCVYLFV